MSKLKEKSALNYCAADVLINSNYYAPSVHCSYYSCFQLMKYSIKYFFDINYEDLAKQIGSAKQNTHSYVIKFIGEEMKNNLGLFEYRNFNNKIRDLRNFREQSDYENVDVTFDDSKKALNLAKEIRTKLSEMFHV